jgi:hypothetical protein
MEKFLEDTSYKLKLFIFQSLILLSLIIVITWHVFSLRDIFTYIESLTPAKILYKHHRI